MRIYDYEGWYYLTTEIWAKDRNMLEKDGNVRTARVKDDIMYEKIIDDEIITSSLTNESFSSEGVVKTRYWYLIDSLKEKLKDPISIFKYSIKSAIVNGKKCYQFISNEDILYFDKETGLVVRWENLAGQTITGIRKKVEIQSTLNDYEYEFNVVEDKDLEE